MFAGKFQFQSKIYHAKAVLEMSIIAKPVFSEASDVRHEIGTLAQKT